MATRPGFPMRLLSLVWLVGVIVSGEVARAYSTHGEVAVSRTFSKAQVSPGQVVTVTITVQIGSIEGAFRGFYLSDAIPSALALGSDSVVADSGSLAVVRESSAAGATYPNCVNRRWVLETPPDWLENQPLAVSSSLVVSYDVSVPAAAQPGEIKFPGFNWVGMIAALGDSGDHFGFEDGEATLEVVATGEDRDGDGMPDDWETSHGLNPDDPSDANKDSDQDGLSNLGEYQHGTRPESSDSDDDGMPDGWEVQNGLNPLVDDASQDPDGDGYSNREEFAAGSNPRDSASTPDGGADGDGGGDRDGSVSDQEDAVIYGGCWCGGTGGRSMDPILLLVVLGIIVLGLRTRKEIQ